MALKRGKLEFHHVVGMKTHAVYGNWQKEAQMFRAFLVKNDVFIIGPVIVQWDNMDEKSGEADLILYLPTYSELSLEENDTFFYMDYLCVEDGIKIRHADMDDEVQASIAILETVADKSEVQLAKPYYYIYLPVFGEYILDIYAPIDGSTAE